jgi:hypothetical protein
MDFSSSKTPSTAIPISLNGNSRIQIIGYKTRARSASGQQKINSKSHSNSFTTRATSQRLWSPLYTNPVTGDVPLQSLLPPI